MALIVMAFSASFAFAGTPVNVTNKTTPVLSSMVSMQINETMHMKVNNPKDFEGANIKELKKGDDVEVKKIGADKFEVRHLPTGKTSVMTRSK